MKGSSSFESPVPEHRTTSSRVRLRLLLAVAVLTISGAVWGVSQTQRSAADRAFAQSRAAEQMLTAMLDQEAGLRGFALFREEEFLDPFVRGERAFAVATDSARRNGNESGRKALDEQVAVASQWQRLARAEIPRLRAQKNAPLLLTDARARTAIFDRYRRLNAQLQERIGDARRSDLGRAGLISVAVIIALAFLFGGVGYFAIERQATRERQRRERALARRVSQSEFNETMQIMRDKDEAYALVKLHLERAIPRSSVVVLTRNNSADRLTAATPLPEDSPLAPALAEARPGSCLAVRLAREYHGGEDADPLLTCDICGVAAGETTCVPSVVGGEVIGSVLVVHPDGLGPEQRESVSDSVSHAAPVLANLRTLVIAETRAATDDLSGLPNRRACQDNLKRMLAHASRAVSPLSAILLDLDHFKQINDRYGHGAGDDVLASIGEVLRGGLRASDFAGRYGGEEFLVLLPNTDSAGALVAAEKLRAAVEKLDVLQVEQVVTASFGVAAYPVDALDADALVRMADRALYAAKGAGRNRVELAMPSSEAAEPAAAQPG
jgi:diguanylate cyclase (GGDEF)-like protein